MTVVCDTSVLCYLALIDCVAVERLLGETNFRVSAEVVDRLRRAVGVSGLA